MRSLLSPFSHEEPSSPPFHMRSLLSLPFHKEPRVDEMAASLAMFVHVHIRQR